MSDLERPKVWFPAKQYGWGWDLPVCWQGWVVLLAYIVLLPAGAFVFRPDRQMPQYLAYTGILTGLLIAVSWWKGEKPAWRWGEHTAAAALPKASRRGLLFFHVFMGPLLLAFAFYVRTHLPAEINGTYGYRTATSMQNQEIWDEAQRFSANAMIAAAAITILYQAISCFTMKPLVSILTSSGVLVLVLCAAIPVTEMHLKKHFDQDGRRITAITAEQPPERDK